MKTQDFNKRLATLKRQGAFDQVLAEFSTMLWDPDLPYPDKVSYNTAIDAAGKNRNMDDVEDLFVAMIEDGFRPDVRTFTSIIHSYTKSADARLCWIIHLMHSMGVVWNEYTYSAATAKPR